jgi:hypothetical protein
MLRCCAAATAAASALLPPRCCRRAGRRRHASGCRHRRCAAAKLPPILRCCAAATVAASALLPPHCHHRAVRRRRASRCRRRRLEYRVAELEYFSNNVLNVFFWADFRYLYVIFKIRPMSYFHKGNCMPLHRNANTPPPKPGYFMVFIYPQVVHSVVFTTNFFVSVVLICTAVTEKNQSHSTHHTEHTSPPWASTATASTAVRGSPLPVLAQGASLPHRGRLPARSALAAA